MNQSDERSIEQGGEGAAQPSVQETTTGAEADSEQTIDDGAVAEAECETLEGEELASLVEALLFASGEPLSADRLAEVARTTGESIEEAVALLKARFERSESGFEIVSVANKYQLRTRPFFASYIRALRAGKPRRLSNAALETVAVIAYRQPVVKSDIEKIRGVDVAPTLKTLMERGLIRIVGHEASVGQPALYGTSEEFLKLFGLNSLSELPSLRDIKELERDPGEPETSEEEGRDEGAVAVPTVDDVGGGASVRAA